jgi:N-acetylneuraminic acid mutarotase
VVIVFCIKPAIFVLNCSRTTDNTQPNQFKMKAKKILIGVLVFTSVLCPLTSYLFAQGTWSQKASLPASAKRGEQGSFTINGKGYIFGGSATYPTWLSDCWEYDPIADTWTQKASLPVVGPREPAFFTIGNLGYSATGFYGSGASSAVSKNLYVFDPTANTWTKKTDFGGTARRDAVGFSIGTKGYVATGADGAGQTGDLWEYNPTADTWTQKSNFLGTTRNAATSFAIGTKGYITTGRSGTTTFNDLWEYDPSASAGGTWTQKANYPGVTRSEAVSFVLGTKGYVGSGHTAGPPDFWEFDQALNSWSAITTLPGGERAEAVGFAIGNKGYVAQGAVVGNGTQIDLWEFVPAAMGVSELNNTFSFSVHPNPSSGKLQLSAFGHPVYSVEIFNMEGEKVYSENPQCCNFAIDLSSRPNGIYFIAVKSANGLEAEVQKIIIHK